MKMKILILLGIFIFVQNPAQAVETREKLTRISIAASSDIKYESRLLDDPPRLVLKFGTPNVFGKLVEKTSLDDSVIKDITVSYYPGRVLSSDRRKIKFLTFWLSQKTSYKIWSENNRIFIDFKNPAPGWEPKQIEITSIVSTIDLAAKSKAAEELLASVNKAYNAPVVGAIRTSPGIKTADLMWLLAFLLTGVYVLWFRPKEWKNLMERIAANQEQAKQVSCHEKRKWWRHNLLPLKNKSLYIKLKAAASNTSLGLFPRDIGYGGLSFECNRLKRLKGKLNFSIFLPGAASPVEVDGKVAWQRNSSNIFRRRVGVSFINPPDKDWSRIHRYIEEQYAGLKQ